MRCRPSRSRRPSWRGHGAGRLAWVAVSVGVWLLTMVVAQGQMGPRSPVPAGAEPVDWTLGTVQSHGQATAPPAGGERAARRAAAVAASVHTARQQLLETLGQLRLTAERTIADTVQGTPEKQQALAGLVAEAEVIATRYLPQDTVESTVQLPVFGRLTTLFWPDTSTAAAAPGASPAGAVYTGIIIDARGLAVHPALFPRLVDESGQTLYAPAQVDASIAAQRGYVVYASAVDNPQLEVRVGKQPLIFRARRVLGPARVDVVVKQPDAAQLQGSEALRFLLMQCRVVIVG